MKSKSHSEQKYKIVACNGVCLKCKYFIDNECAKDEGNKYFSK